MENISPIKLKIIAYVFLSLTVISIISLIIVPIIYKKSIESNYKDKTFPSKDNINIWAKFPGDIMSKTTHTFKILDYSDEMLNIKDSITLEENTTYDNFVFVEKNNKIKFDAKSEFSLDKSKQINDSIKSINLGMFELLESFSNPSIYQKGINSILYLFNKVLNTPELFIKKIFSYDLFTTLLTNETKVRETILKDIDKEKADKILSKEEIYKKYSFSNLEGFYNWIKILNNQEKITISIWLYDLFNLTEIDINSILGNDSYLNNEYNKFNSDLAIKFDCFNKTFCGNEIFYKQLLSNEVLSNYKLNNISDLYQKINPEFYTFSKSPELFIFFEEFKQRKGKPDIQYKDYAPNFNLLYNILDESSNNSLLSSKISSLFLIINNTNNINKANELYNNISLNNIEFISDYVYNYLPKLFIYQEYLDENNNVQNIEQFAYGFINIAQKIINNSYGLLRKIKNQFNMILLNFVFESLLDNMMEVKIKLIKNYNKVEPDELCPLIMQLALNDGKKVLKICSDPKTAFDTPETLSKWLPPFYCIIRNETNCDMSIIDYLRSLVYITDDEIKAIYNKDYLGGTIDFFDNNLTKAFNCISKEECTDEYISKLQFWKSAVSLNLPYNKTKTFNELFPDIIPYPVEINYYIDKFNYTNDIKEEDIDEIIGLYLENGNILDEDNYQIFENKIKMEKEYSLKKDEKDNTLYKAIHILNKGLLFGNDIKNDYENIYNILQDNYKEDKKYIQFLSEGDIYEGYKPNINHTTGFNFGFNLSDGNPLDILYDKYEISSKEDNLREITSINDFGILNLEKIEYDYLSKDYKYITTPLYNYQSLIAHKQFSDGFQYDSSEETIYLYDKISSRPLKFVYKEVINYGEINCEKFELDKDDISNNINELIDQNSSKAFLSQKLNKPFIISLGNDVSNINEEISDENFICVDSFTNEVVQSKINLVYSIYSKNYGYINPNIENEKIYPVFVYQKVFEVDNKSYLDNFPDITFYSDFKMLFLIIGIVLIVIFIIITLIAFVVIHKIIIKKENNYEIFKDNINNNNQEENLINDSRGQSIVNQKDENN